MNKVKIMLTAITVLAGVGGALAFKANNMREARFCISKVGTTCTFTVTSNQGGLVPLTAVAFPAAVTKCTLANGGNGVPCPTRILITNE
jgi:hypothetical protein